MLPDDPLRATAHDNGPADGWQGARLRHRAELARGRDRRLEVDPLLGAARVPRIVGLFLLVSVFATLVEFSRLGTNPSASELAEYGGIWAGSLGLGNWWSVVTANLLHGGLGHVAMNAFIIYLAGRWAELLVGRTLMVATIAWSIVGTSVGALLVSPEVVSVGASGVAFGILGVALVVDPRARTIAGSLARTFTILNVVATFLVPGISIGGHLGGLAAGVLVGLVGWGRGATEERPIGAPRRITAPFVAAVGVALVAALCLFDVVLHGTAVRWGEEVGTWFITH